MFNALGLLKLYHAAQYTFQHTFPQTHLVPPLCKSLCNCVESNLALSIPSLRSIRSSELLKGGSFSSATAQRAQITSRAVAFQHRSALMRMRGTPILLHLV